MQRVAPHWGLLTAAVIACATCGCGKDTSGPTAVAGKITYRGSALRAGTIVFTPDPTRGTPGPPVGVDIQADGNYRLPAEGTPELPAGWYRVTVAAVEMLPPAPGQAFGKPRSLLPPRYRDPDRSGLSCEVKAGKANAINFNLD